MNTCTGDSVSLVSKPMYVPVATKLVSADSRCAPPAASTYFASVCSAGGAATSGKNLMEVGSSTSAVYCSRRLGERSGCGSPL
jgi:hypothetical protein